MTTGLPAWVVVHMPHDSTVIPATSRYQFALTEIELADEILKMTDHLTLDLFAADLPTTQVARAPVSRLVVDVERFEEDAREPMATCGMGVVYLKTSAGNALRHPLSQPERQALIDTWYRPHHERLSTATQRAIDQFGKALVIDAHSFPSQPLPYETDQDHMRPEICIGTDDFHTPQGLAHAIVAAFMQHGFDVRMNAPFAGALVPLRFYRQDLRASAVMIEVRRDLYIDEATGKRNAGFKRMQASLRDCLCQAVANWDHQNAEQP